MPFATDFRSRYHPNISGIPRSGCGEIVKTRSFGLFWPVLYASAHLFWFPLRSKRFGNPGVLLRGNRENSQFCPIPASFICHSPLIFGPDTIRTFRESHGPVAGKSSKLAVLVYFGQFCMLVLTYFGSRYDPNVSGTPWSGNGELVRTHSFGQFRPVLFAITHSIWFSLRSEHFGNPRVRLRGNHENSLFWPIPASFVCY